ncbi:hypothetical protein KKG65_00425 [Patescibacteria group bacterium]|nr:hypothetical protein [Patescibacteria group bacterium]
MTEETDKLLTKGLQEGFAGRSVIQNVKRGGFTIKSSHFKDGDGNVYHDEWSADRAGGGQEIVKVGETSSTRVYAGGTIPSEKLKLLGISEGDVVTFLKKQITENKGKIRLHTNFEPEPEGDWQYSYRILDTDKEIPLTVGKELIKYKGKLVFVHDFIISPID